MRRDDTTRLHHMIDAANEAMSFAEGLQPDAIHRDRMLALAVVRCIEVVGEAANGISDDLRKSSPHIPWRAVIAMRNRLVHGYFDIDLDRVWDTLTEDLPPLVDQLNKLLSRAP